MTLLISAVLLTSEPAAADRGFYLAGSIGSAELDEEFDGFDVDDSSTAYRILAGFQFNEYFAAEAGYHNFGDFEDFVQVGGETQQIKLSADGFTIGIVGSLPLHERFALQGRTGVFYWDGDAEINNASSASPEDTNPYFGVGGAFDITPGFQLTGDWTRYELDSANSGVFSVGFRYRFGRQQQ